MYEHKKLMWEVDVQGDEEQARLLHLFKLLLNNFLKEKKSLEIGMRHMMPEELATNRK
jgi:hypothetical protein